MRDDRLRGAKPRRSLAAKRRAKSAPFAKLLSAAPVGATGPRRRLGGGATGPAARRACHSHHHPGKNAAVARTGADRVIDRDTDPVAVLGRAAVDVVIDNVAGPRFGALLDVLRRGGKYASSGAIGGPIVTLDMRVFYLRDLTLIGCTARDEPVFPDLITYIARGEIRPLLARTCPLDQIATAQQDFLQKSHVGNFALIPPHP